MRSPPGEVTSCYVLFCFRYLSLSGGYILWSFLVCLRIFKPCFWVERETKKIHQHPARFPVMWLREVLRSDCSKPVQACSVVKSATPVNLVFLCSYNLLIPHVLFWNNCSAETQCFNRIPPLSLRSRRLEVVQGARKNWRARGRHATPSPLACLPLVHPFFLAPTTSFYFQAPST